MLEGSDAADEDYRVEGEAFDALERLCDEWNAGYAEKTWFPDGQGIVFDCGHAVDRAAGEPDRSGEGMEGD